MTMELLRANYTLGDRLMKNDFVGENHQKEFAQWLSETASKEESFRYLGRDIILKPIHWLYNDRGELEIWNDIAPQGSPDKVVREPSDIEWFFEKHLGVPMGDVHIGDNDIAENPDGWFNPESPYVDDVIGEDLDEFEEDIVVPRKRVTKNEMSKFELWLRTFVEEKDLPVENFEIKHNGNVHLMDNYDMIEIMCELPEEHHDKIKQMMVTIDFLNGNVNHFIRHLAEGYIYTNY
jgi:hypothetical protein